MLSGVFQLELKSERLSDLAELTQHPAGVQVSDTGPEHCRGRKPHLSCASAGAAPLEKRQLQYLAV